MAVLPKVKSALCAASQLPNATAAATAATATTAAAAAAAAADDDDDDDDASREQTLKYPKSFVLFIFNLMQNSFLWY